MEVRRRLTMLVHLLILNYNVRELLAQCLPSIVEAARRSRHACRVAVVDNSSTDDSIDWLAEHYPEVRIFLRANRGLCSLNDVVANLPGEVALLLNNDIRLAPDAIDPLCRPLAAGGDPDCFMTAPHCLLFDGATYEGFKTAVRWRWGLVQATAFFPGHEECLHRPDLTASVGAALAVRCDRFTELGGFDPRYLPGRLEDLDLAYRGFLAGYHIRYVPTALSYHRGMASFGRAFGAAGCDRLALRNTLLFQWKNLRHPMHWMRHAAGLTARLARELIEAPLREPARRWLLARTLVAAWRIHREAQAGRDRRNARPWSPRRERRFFTRFSPDRLRRCNARREFPGRQPERAVSESRDLAEVA